MKTTDSFPNLAAWTFLFVAFLILPHYLAAQASVVPDGHFKTFLITKGVDADNNGQISAAEAAAIQSLKINMYWIDDLSGIEYFVSLLDLEVTSLVADTLDLSGNRRLRSLNLQGWNSLQSLNVSQLDSLQTLYIREGNNLNTLDLSGLVQLETLELRQTKTVSIQFPASPKLKTISLTGLLQLKTSFNFPAPALSKLWIYTCYSLDTLILGDFPALERLSCGSSRLRAMHWGELPKLRLLGCSFNMLTRLDGLDRLPKLDTLSCAINQIETLDFGPQQNIQQIVALVNQLDAIRSDLPLENLTQLDAGTNLITDAGLPDAPNLTYLDLTENLLNNPDVNRYPKLDFLRIGRNPLDTLNLSGLSLLETLDIGFATLPRVDIRFNTQLTELDARFCPGLEVCTHVQPVQDQQFEYAFILDGRCLIRTDESPGLTFSTNCPFPVSPPGEDNLSIFPNPVHDILYLNWPEILENESLSLHILDHSGRSLINIEDVPCCTYQLKTDNWAAGYYSVIIRQGTYLWREKFMKFAP